MKVVSKEDVIKTLGDTGNLDNPGVLPVIQKSVGFYELTIEDETTLFSLIYQSHPHNRILTPFRSKKDHFYTVGEVADLMIQNKWTFEAFVAGNIQGDYKPFFFEGMMPIYRNYNHDLAHHVIVRPVGERTRYFCPHGTFYIEDGAHRTLVTTYLIKTGRIPFRPLKYFFIQPKQTKTWLERQFL